MKYLKITRFSYDGFDPQCQQGFLDECCIEKDSNYNPEFDYGVWTFVAGQEDRFLLNHRRDVPNLTCWEAEIPYDAIVFKHEDPFEYESISTVAQEKKNGAFFIPKSSLDSLVNIKNIYNVFS